MRAHPAAADLAVSEIGGDHSGVGRDRPGRPLGDLDAIAHHDDAVGELHHQVELVGIARAMMGRPRLICMDEPSMGLAPQIVEEIFAIVRDLNSKEGVSFLLAEKNTNMALRYASHGYILENGRVVMDGEARALASNEDVKEFYLGVAGDKRKSFRDVKHYKRRKRWLL